MRKHAILSPSAAHRWLACPPSAVLCAEAEDQRSPYAKQGSDAHALCEHLLKEALGLPTEDPTGELEYYDEEMRSCAEGYRDFVMEKVAEARASCPDPLVCVEQRLDFSRWVKDGFGTGDCVIAADGLLHVIDYKYGVGVVVPAERNPQLMCYALGAVDAFGGLYGFETVKLSIYQPRRENACTYEMPVSELMEWAEEVLAPAARLAAAGEGAFHAGSHCVFCRVKATCRERADYCMELAKHEFREASALSDGEIAAILPKIDSLAAWAADVKEYALRQALSGVRYEGYKVVEGRSNRKYTDEAEVARAVMQEGFDPYEKKLLGVTAMQKLLGKKQFNDILGDYVVKPPGKPVLVPASDKRPEYSTAADDFKDI